MALKTVIQRIGELVTRPEPVRNGLLLSGGGARAAYQAGVLQYIAEEFPNTSFPIIAGVSAGAINAAHLATHDGSLGPCTSRLVDSWRDLQTEEVFTSESNLSWATSYVKSWGKGDSLGGKRALLDTAPLRDYLIKKVGTEDGTLNGVGPRIEQGMLRALAVLTTNYSTGQTVTWIQGSNIDRWERPSRVGINTTITVDHIMASSALPILFPAIKIGNSYFGDGGVRLAAPLAPVVHLGANRILAISTRYARTRAEADSPAFEGYPPLGQIFGLLMNSIFLDALDQDALMMDRINALLDQLPHRKRLGLRPVELLVLRPSVDLGKLAGEFETAVTGPLKLLARTFGSSKSPDWLSMLLFEKEYVGKLIEIGYSDAKAQHAKIQEFLTPHDERPPARRESGLRKTA